MIWHVVLALPDAHDPLITTRRRGNDVRSIATRGDLRWGSHAIRQAQWRPLATQSAVDLGAVAARAAIERAGISPADIDDTIFGQVLQGGAGQNPARQVSLGGHRCRHSRGNTNRVCGSGMRAVTLADSLIRAGDYDVVLAGGMESMTNTPYILRKARTGYRMGTASSKT